MELFNSEYIQQIRQRMKMDAVTQKQREMRTAHFLMEQSKACAAEQVRAFYLSIHFLKSLKTIWFVCCHLFVNGCVFIQGALFESSLTKRLTQQTQEEERLVALRLQMRSQKETFKKTNLIRHQQILKKRERDFLEALDREAVPHHSFAICIVMHLCKVLSRDFFLFPYNTMISFESCLLQHRPLLNRRGWQMRERSSASWTCARS